MSTNRSLMLKLDKVEAHHGETPYVSVGRSLSKRGRKKWGGDIKRKSRGMASAAAKLKDLARRRAYNASR